jgi:hypothetical protein
LASFIIGNLQRRFSTDGTVIYFFCSGRSATKSVSITILKSVVYQLREMLPNASEKTEDAFHKSPNTIAQFNELWELFRTLISTEKTVYCVVDGLDECSGTSDDGNLERSLFARRLIDIAKQVADACRLKILFSSRNEPDIQFAFKSMDGIVDILGITKEDVDMDIASCISNRVGQSEILSELDDNLKARLVWKLQENSSGMFIWARLVIEELDTHVSVEDIEGALRFSPMSCMAFTTRSSLNYLPGSGKETDCWTWLVLFCNGSYMQRELSR